MSEPLRSRVSGRIAPARRAHGNPPAPMPATGSARHRNGGQRVFSVNTLFWKILVTRVKRKMRNGKIPLPLRQLAAAKLANQHRAPLTDATKSEIPPLEFTHEGTPRDASVAATALRKQECAETLPNARTRRHRDGAQCVISVNTLFWKILVTRVKRKMQGTRKQSPVRSSIGRFIALLQPFHRSRSHSRPARSRGDDQRTYHARSSRAA